jgi:hypothetical protein
VESLIDGAEGLTSGQIKLFLERTIRTDYALKVMRDVTTGRDEAPAEKRDAAQTQTGTG